MAASNSEKSYEDEAKINGVYYFGYRHLFSRLYSKTFYSSAAPESSITQKVISMIGKETVLKVFVSVNLLLENRYRSGIAFNS